MDNKLCNKKCKYLDIQNHKCTKYDVTLWQNINLNYGIEFEDVYNHMKCDGCETMNIKKERHSPS